MFRKLSLASVLILLAAVPGFAWHAEGHARASHEAVALLPADMPEFFRNGAVTIEQDSSDPDLFCKPMAAPELGNTEGPEHYFDSELIEGQELPADRYEFLKIIFQKNIEPAKMGMLPYALTEWTDRLTVSFAEYRRWPNDAEVQKKILVYAGILSHYAGDACMPLHTTINHDGKSVNGQPAKKGIHRKVDALLGKLSMDVKVDVDKSTIKPAGNLREFIMAQLKNSYSLVEPVYAMEAEIPAYDAALPASGTVFEFTKERLGASAVFIARLYATAWANSKNVEIPEWHQRPIPCVKVITPTSRPAK